MSVRVNQGDANSTSDAPDFRIVTTLKHTLFNAEDAESDSATDAGIGRWKDLSKKLFALHTRRLREAAEAFGWVDVVKRLSVPATGAQASEPEDEERLSPQTEPFNLERFVEDAAVATSQGGSSPGPGRGFLRDLRVRVLMSRDGQLAVECTVMGADRPLSTLTRAVDMYTSCPFAATVPGEGEQRGAATPPCHVTVDAQPTRTSLFTRHKTTHRAPYDDARARAGSPPLLPTTSPTAREVLLSNAAGQVTEASLSAVYFLRGGAWLTPRSDCGGLQSVTRLYALEAGWCDEGIVPVHEVAEGEVVWLSNAVRGFFPGVVKLHGQNGRENST
ncbi:hypothetical protein CLAIMM_08066 isoform 1 [Cladophialophora immunda]|nr:hypothetical protein CLAIMM_08066 isoform 1 [Cladophialophora immunda]